MRANAPGLRQRARAAAARRAGGPGTARRSPRTRAAPAAPPLATSAVTAPCRPTAQPLGAGRRRAAGRVDAEAADGARRHGALMLACRATCVALCSPDPSAVSPRWRRCCVGRTGIAPVVVLGPPWLGAALSRGGAALVLVESEVRPQAVRVRRRARKENQPPGRGAGRRRAAVSARFAVGAGDRERRRSCRRRDPALDRRAGALAAAGWAPHRRRRDVQRRGRRARRRRVPVGRAAGASCKSGRAKARCSPSASRRPRPCSRPPATTWRLSAAAVHRAADAPARYTRTDGAALEPCAGPVAAGAPGRSRWPRWVWACAPCRGRVDVELTGLDTAQVTDLPLGGPPPGGGGPARTPRRAHHRAPRADEPEIAGAARRRSGAVRPGARGRGRGRAGADRRPDRLRPARLAPDRAAAARSPAHQRPGAGHRRAAGPPARSPRSARRHGAGSVPVLRRAA